MTAAFITRARPGLAAAFVCLLWIAGAGAQDGGEDPCVLVNEFGLGRFDNTQDLVKKCEEQEAAPLGTSRALPGDKAAADTADEELEAIDYVEGDGSRAIYGEDDRLEPSQLAAQSSHPRPDLLAKAVKATAALVYRKNLLPLAGGRFRLKLRPYTPGGKPLCEGQNFAKQRVGAHCTSFLIAPNLVATAGHCIKWEDVNSLDRSRNTFAIVFGFEMKDGRERDEFRPEDVYEIKSVVEHFLDGSGNTLRDFAVVELDRDVPDAVAEPLRLAGRAGLTVRAKTRLGVIGYPSGLPAKVSFSDKSVSQAMEEGSDTMFRAQLNTFKGNSGSPTLFWDQPDVVAGILVQGEQDFIPTQDNCWVHAIYKSDELCNGKRCSEKVTKSALIEPYVP